MRFPSITILASLSIAACSTLTYQEPQTGPLARVRFVTDSNQISVLRTYGDKNCTTNEVEWLRLRNGMMINSSPKRLGMPLWNYHDNAAKEVFVEANKQIYGLFQGGETTALTTYLCGTPFSYSFQDGADYEVRFKWAPQECRVTIAQIVDGPKGMELREQAAFSNQVNETNKGCLAAFNKPRLY
ncbi:hypothetical protein [Aeromonas eucrenophila]|uniref:Lipoprotein n=1 Tax=Aeromonas eucrenophila TaxID=649 RepID=A0ABW0YJH3_9GAMM|nr:hypothetical protein [Aeromonas eucrenophila]